MSTQVNALCESLRTQAAHHHSCLFQSGQSGSRDKRPQLSRNPLLAAARARIHLSVQSPMLRLARARRCRQLLPRGRQKPDQSSTDRFQSRTSGDRLSSSFFRSQLAFRLEVQRLLHLEPTSRGTQYNGPVPNAPYRKSERPNLISSLKPVAVSTAAPSAISRIVSSARADSRAEWNRFRSVVIATWPSEEVNVRYLIASRVIPSAHPWSHLPRPEVIDNRRLHD